MNGGAGSHGRSIDSGKEHDHRAWRSPIDPAWNRRGCPPFADVVGRIEGRLRGRAGVQAEIGPAAAEGYTERKTSAGHHMALHSCLTGRSEVPFRSPMGLDEFPRLLPKSDHPSPWMGEGEDGGEPVRDTTPTFVLPRRGGGEDSLDQNSRRDSWIPLWISYQ